MYRDAWGLDYPTRGPRTGLQTVGAYRLRWLPTPRLTIRDIVVSHFAEEIVRHDVEQ